MVWGGVWGGVLGGVWGVVWGGVWGGLWGGVWGGVWGESRKRSADVGNPGSEIILGGVAWTMARDMDGDIRSYMTGQRLILAIIT